MKPRPKRELWKHEGQILKKTIYRLEYNDRVWQVFRSPKRKGTDFYLTAWTPDIDNPIQVIRAHSWRELLKRIDNSSINDVIIPFPKNES